MGPGRISGALYPTEESGGGGLDELGAIDFIESKTRLQELLQSGRLLGGLAFKYSQL